MDIRMIVTDLDNTLLSGDKRISDYTAETLAQCMAAGIKVVFATARSMPESARILARLSPDAFIGCGGAASRAGSALLPVFDIPADIADRLITDCLSSRGISYLFVNGEGFERTNDIELPKQRDFTHYIYDEFETLPGKRCYKISAMCDSPAEAERVAACFPSLDTTRFSGEDLYRFASPKATKWNALQNVMAHFGIEARETAAFGDDHIDVEILQKCGIGVAVANAVDAARAAADYICGTNDADGVAKWLRKNLL